MKAPEDFYKEIISTQKKASIANFDFGNKVIPVIEIYKRIKTNPDRKAFEDALEKILASENKDIRKLGIDICLGFFMLKDVV